MNPDNVPLSLWNVFLVRTPLSVHISSSTPNQYTLSSVELDTWGYECSWNVSTLLFVLDETYFSMGLFCYCFSSTVNSYLTVSRINWTITLSRDTTYSYSRWHQDPIDVKIWSQAKPNRSSIRNIFTFSVRTRLCVFLGSLKIHAWSVFKDLG